MTHPGANVHDEDQGDRDVNQSLERRSAADQADVVDPNEEVEDDDPQTPHSD